MLKHLSQQIIISLTIIVMVVSGISGYVSLRNREREILQTMISGVDQLSKGITSAVWHAMLADDRAAAYEVMKTVASKQGISRIRIFNKEGTVMFSTKVEDASQVDKNAEACVMCHSPMRQPLVNIDASSRSRVFTLPDGSRQLAMITPIYNEPSCSDADCHAHPRSTNVLGVLDVALDLKLLDHELQSAKNEVYVVTGIQILLIGLFIIFFTRRFVDRPIRKLIAGTKAVSRMQLDHVVEINSSQELGELAHAFNLMSERLDKAMAELNQAAQDLEIKVKERTKQLEAAHQKLLQSDRLASLGQLSATVAHEINNPLFGVLNLAALLERIVKEDGIPLERVPEFKKYLGQIINETSRVGRIVSDLLAFSRRSKPQTAYVDLNAVISTTLMILSHRLKLGNVELKLQLQDDLPRIECDGSQMQQVVINLVMNGAEACQNKGQGTVAITTAQEKDFIVLEISDDGDGIPSEIMSKIFDPFFTTKGEGKGVGLGLSVVYGIVDAHGGDIAVDSKVGEGTTFKVTLPIKKTDVAAKQKV
ncbi:MAG TPA: ATP-binding protein [Candidatus Acidoferrales bacterium]|nr:ATP-binding protein [Candidatus Acidoferrales bacterium]